MKKFVCTVCGYVHEGNEAPAQIRCKKGNVAEIIFIADMDALSLKVYDI